MAFRVFARVFRDSAVFSRRVAAAARHRSASWLLGSGNAACIRGGRNGFNVSPACFITSETFVDWQRSLAAEADGNLSRPPASLPPDSSEHMSLFLRNPDQPDNSKVLKVAIIGSPNAGKSTLSNQLLGRKVFPVSKKVHTTRCSALGVLTEDGTQIIVLDTPGLTTASKVKKHHLEKSLLVDPWNTVKEADLLVAMVDVSDKWTCNSLHPELLKCLASHADIPAILVLNKVDCIKAKDRLLNITAALTCGMVNGHRIGSRPAAEDRPGRRSASSPDEDDGGHEDGAESKSPLSKEQLKALKSQRGWPCFKDIFMLCAVDKEDVDTLKSYFMAEAKPGSWEYHSEVLTNQNPEDVCVNTIREKLLEYLSEEVPYNITQFVDYWQEGENDELVISVKLYTQKSRHVSFVLGTAGELINRIAREAGEDLSRLFGRNVALKLTVRAKG